MLWLGVRIGWLPWPRWSYDACGSCSTLAVCLLRAQDASLGPLRFNTQRNYEKFITHLQPLRTLEDLPKQDRSQLFDAGFSLFQAANVWATEHFTEVCGETAARHFGVVNLTNWHGVVYLSVNLV